MASVSAISSIENPASAVVPQTVRKRDGNIAAFDPVRIRVAITKAFRAEFGLGGEAPLPAELTMAVAQAADTVVGWCEGRTALGVERIQDEVERVLMTRGEHRVARRYVLYREQRAVERRGRTVHYRRADGTDSPLDTAALRRRIAAACKGLPATVAGDAVFDQTVAQLYPGIPEAEIGQAAIMAARARIEIEPDYTFVAARLLLDDMRRDILGDESTDVTYRSGLHHYVTRAVETELLAPSMLEFDFDRLAAAIAPERDLRFAYLGLQTLHDRYLLRHGGRVVELPQWFWIRVAMGLALGELDRTGRAIEFYGLISQFLFTPATPTLFNAGTGHPQLSSCYLTTVDDDLAQIFKSIGDNALLSKWAGGLGNDWTNVRALGSRIRGTGGTSQGVIPFLKIVNDAAVAVNQGGKRKGAVCAYLETWHLDIEEFLELRKNTGDERRRTHDMNTANWIPDLFMRRVAENGTWTLFSPDDVRDLHDLYGQAFNERYEHYERLADDGRIALFKRLPAVELWRKMLSALFETGHPWITWKDPSNIRSPQDHAGVVHNSNLCTEILLNNSADETAVCNLGSINLAAHVADRELNVEQIANTVRTAVRMLDNVIDLNFYPTPEARSANMRHRPVGLGLMGFQDMLHALGIGYASDEAVVLADRSMEVISYFAILASTELARERGTYSSYAGSKWQRGLLPIDTIDLLEAERGVAIPVSRRATLDWQNVREAVAAHGMRNSNLLAIAPTATISNIIGTSQSIEPSYKNLYVKSNLSGEFTQVNRYLVESLRERGLWDADMLDALKYYDGALGPIERVPDELKRRYQMAFEIEPRWMIECAARRQKWIDMGQSLNLYMLEPNGRRLDEMYRLAWQKGLKTTYYLRTLAATQIEKSTLDVNRWGIQPRWMKARSASADIQVARPAACSADGECEACQ
ncbi:MAG TPA: ribonucleoside-diphosphate reductase subunit alpha [Pirellulales bacterium]|jgi:ribonucleoside-diphosphate reductase alpha chain|nr:ribonucleoside-diphosphate reductase subunit alpha [Pirellulales bacterium]